MNRKREVTIAKPLVFKKKAGTSDPSQVCDFFARHTGLPKTRIKDAMGKGAAWLRRGTGKRQRIRRATAPIKRGDILELFYDETILNREAPEALLVKDLGLYSVWHKPPGLVTEGTNYGDHCSLLRQVEEYFVPARQIFPIHRIDYEASGLVILAHDQKTAAALSRLFRDHLIEKRYRIEVLGNPSKKMPRGLISIPLDGKEAVTEFVLERYYPETDISTVAVRLRTGRLHQIRRHFEMIGHPVMGDPKHGRKNKNTEGMKLSAIMLRFPCPVTGQDVTYTLDEAPPRAGIYRL